LSNQRWETYFYKLKFFDENDHQITTFDKFFSNRAGQGFDQMFDNNPDTKNRFPTNGVPEEGDYLELHSTKQKGS
jgi:hypothetical protein